MTMESRSAKIIFSVFAAILIMLGISNWLISFSGYVFSLILFGAALIIYVELGLKKFTSLSELDEFDIGNWITFIVATIILIYAVLMLPIVLFNIPVWMATVASVAVIISGVFVIKEAFI